MCRRTVLKDSKTPRKLILLFAVGFLLSTPSFASDRERGIQSSELTDPGSDSMKERIVRGSCSTGLLLEDLFFEGKLETLGPAIIWYQRGHEEGDLESTNRLALLYLMGRGVEPDPARAMALFRKAAADGHAMAQYNLGLRYDQGEVVNVDKRQAFNWYMKSAEQGFASAQRAVADMYFVGNGVDQSKPKAIEWYKLAAKNGDAVSIYNVAVFLMEDNGHTDETLALLKSAADQDHVNSHLLLAQYFSAELEDYDKEWVHLRKAADLGSAVAWHDIGVKYGNGRGVDKDPDAALFAFEVALSLGLEKSRESVERLRMKRNN